MHKLIHGLIGSEGKGRADHDRVYGCFTKPDFPGPADWLPQPGALAIVRASDLNPVFSALFGAYSGAGLVPTIRNCMAPWKEDKKQIPASI